MTAALEAFATRGVDGTPITDLEDAAGLAPGSGGFYRYFRTKDEVLHEVLRREIDRVVAEHAVPEEPSGQDAHAAVAAEIEAMLRTLRSLSPLMAILAREKDRLGELTHAVSDRLVEGGLRRDSARMAALLSGGDVDEEVARRRGAVLISSLVGYTLTCDYFGSAPGGVGLDAFVATLTDLVVPPASA